MFSQKIFRIRHSEIASEPFLGLKTCLENENMFVAVACIMAHPATCTVDLNYSATQMIQTAFVCFLIDAHHAYAWFHTTQLFALLPILLMEFWRHVLSGCQVCDWGIQYHLCSTYRGLWGLVVVRLLWLSGRALAAQARDVLGSTPGDCRLFHFPLSSPHNI